MRVVLALHEGDQTALPAAAGSRKRDGLTLRDGQVQLRKQLRVGPGRIREGHVLELDVAAELGQNLTANACIDQRGAVEDVKDAPGGSAGFGQAGDGRERGAEAKGTHQDGVEDRDHLAQVVVPTADQVPREP